MASTADAAVFSFSFFLPLLLLLLLHPLCLLLLGAPLEEGERANHLGHSHYDRELGTQAATLPASKLQGWRRRHLLASDHSKKKRKEKTYRTSQFISADSSQTPTPPEPPPPPPPSPSTARSITLIAV